MTRRGFLSSLAISTAALYLRFAPASVKAATPELDRLEPSEQQMRFDDSVYPTAAKDGDMFIYRKQKFTALQLLAQLPRQSERRYTDDQIKVWLPSKGPLD